jgi:hypothetical protein
LNLRYCINFESSFGFVERRIDFKRINNSGKDFSKEENIQITVEEKKKNIEHKLCITGGGARAKRFFSVVEKIHIKLCMKQLF